MVAVRIHCVGYSYVFVAIIGYHSNSVGVVFFDSIDELAFVKCYGIVMVAVRIYCVGHSYITLAIIGYHSNGVGIVFFDSIDELAFIKCYGVVVVTVRIHCVGYSYITLAIIGYSSNGVGILSIFLNKALQSIFINTDYIILISQIATAYAVIDSNDSMTGFCGSNSIGIIFLNGLDELIFVNAYGIIVITVIIYHFGNIYITIAVSLRSSNGIGIIFLNGLHELIFVNAHGVIIITVIINLFGNIYITFAVSLCGSNGVSISIILLYKITQLIAVDINLISMVAIYAFIGDFQQIGGSCYSCYGVGINNIFQLISYPATGCYIFYNCIYALTIGIINL